MQSILAVDDSASMRQMLSVLLRGAGYEVVVAADGLDAMEKARGRSVDVVLTDHNMPGMDGLALTRALRAQPQWRSVPVLILTTERGDEMKREARAAGATGWLAKPFEPQQLLQVIRTVAAPQPEA